MQYMLEKVWKVELPFFSKLTGIDSIFFEKYVPLNKAYNLAQVTDLSSYR